MYAYELVNELNFWQWALIVDSQDINAVCETVGIQTAHIGAMYCQVLAGDYGAILITEDTIPKTHSYWYTIDQWRDNWK